MVSMSAAMSDTTMSAPSRASAIACERPWPRAPPVMRATWPVKAPMLFLLGFLVGRKWDDGASGQQEAAVDGHVLAGDEVGCRARQEDCGQPDVVGRPEATGGDARQQPREHLLELLGT